MLKLWSQEMLLRRVITPLMHLQPLSTTAQTGERIQSFRTPEVNPINHSIQNIGQFYTISTDTKKHLFLHGGFPKSYEVQVKTFTEACLMIRQPAVNVISCLKTINYSQPVVRFVLYGKKGSGKSLSLIHILHYAFEAGFLIVHVPWVGNWMRRSKEYSNSETREGYVDLNLDAAAFLLHFKVQNSHILNNPQLIISKDYVWNKRETTPKGALLTELVDHGINRVKYASECVVGLAEEIKKLSNSGICKTLVAVDGYNAFFYPHTRVRTEKKEIVHPSKVTLTEAFLNLTKFDWNNGVAVLTVDEIAIAKADQISYLPKYLLTKDGFNHIDPFVPVPVQSYSEKELRSCLDYYKDRQWIQSVPGQDDELSFISANNPYDIMQLCSSL